MKIARLEVRDFKRIRVVEVTPSGSVVPVRGKNGAGKSSCLDAIAAALGGEKLCPREPVRRGATGAYVRVDFDEAPDAPPEFRGLVVERRWNADGGSTLKLTTREGDQLTKPQTRLDGVLGRFSFDPLAFMRLDPPEQAEALRKLSGIDFSLLDGRRRRAYEERTGVNRLVAQLKAKVAGLPDEPGVPAEPVSGADLMAEQQRRSDQLTANNRRRLELEELHNRHLRFKKTIADHEARIAELQHQIERERAALAADQQEFEANKERGLALKAEVDALVDPDMKEVPEKLRGIEETNRKVRRKQDRAVAQKELASAQADAKKLDDDIAAVDAQKAQVLAEANLPVDGLAFTDEGVTFNGLPLEQASQSQKVRISVAIGSALNPTLRAMLVRNGNDLDPDSLALLAAEAEKADLQVWLEVVSTGPGEGVLIEDGMVESAPAVPEVA